ncbi:hypothetical protein [Dyella psychrodurans]|uniref:DUF3761 domain-containing protein n=1 Tax=Dyella psychrodurans TaxID=1927960 RepID=A0A370XBL1_9GAMM|nr:hypothetical protein [Dyella psychrodurans]RDS85814.1 hypothetical protein DWU99_00630 [Dyella psychrodurans]
MKSFGLIAVVAAALMAAPGVYAQQAASPAGSMTVQCKDGTSVTVTTMKGACHGHKGVDKSASSSSGSSSSNASSASSNASMSAASTTAASSSKSSMSSKSAPAATPAAGGGPGQVWVNTSSKTKAYHCQGSKWYGTTKQGKYMSAADAQAAGYHAAKGEKCS